MNEEQLQALFTQYKSVNPNITDETINETYNNFGDQYIQIIQDELKKKVGTQEQEIISETQIDPTSINTATPNVVSTPLSNDLQLNSQQVEVLNQQQPQSSTESVSIGNQPLLESASTSIPDIQVNLPEISKPILNPVQVIPNFNNRRINETQNSNLDILAGKPNENDVVYNDVSFGEQTLAIGDKENQTQEFLKQYSDKDYLNNQIPLVEKGIEYTSWSTTPEAVKQSNNNLLLAEKNGDVLLKGDENGGIAKDDKGNFKYEILTDKYRDEFNQYINQLNTTAGQENIDRARFNQGNIFNTPEKDESVQYLNDLQKEYGVVFTNEQVDQLTNPQSRKQLEINLETERRLKENPTLDYNTVLAQVTSEKQGLSDQQKYSIGNSYVRDFYLESPENYMDDEKDEYRFYQNFFSNPQNVSDFGEFMNDYGKSIFDTSWIRSNITKKEQKGRKDLFETFLSWKGKNDRLDLELSQRAYENSNVKANGFRAKQDEVAYQSEVDKMNDYLEIYNTASDNLIQRNNEFNQIQNNYSKTLKEQQAKDDFQIRVQNGETLANIENVVGNVFLGAETSVQNAITGMLRIGAIPLGQGNVNDAIDILSQPLSVGNVDIARISDKVVNYKQGNNNYKEINGSLYQVNQDGSLKRPISNISRQNLEKVNEETEYNVSGLAFVTSKMLADIFITQRVGGAIGNTAGKLSNAISNSQKINAVFGEASQLAKSASSFARMAQNPTSVMVNGWTIQMYNDNYLAAQNGGIESSVNKHLYAFATSFILAQIQRINPDTNFLKTINSDQKAIVSALIEGNTQKAILGIESFARKAATNTSKEVVEENVQQGTQDLINVVVNTVGNKNLRVSDVQDYKDVFIGTVVPSIIASGLGGRVRQAEVGGRNIDLTQLTRNELVTELARTPEGITLLQNFKENAFFDSQKTEAQNIIDEVALRQKYINKIPDAENYSTQTINEIIPLLQEIDNKKTKLSTTEDTFKDRVNQEISYISNQVNNLLDNDNNNEQPEIPTQPAPESETVQEQATIETTQPQQVETPTVSESSVELTPEQQAIRQTERLQELPLTNQEDYNEAQSIINSIDFNNEESITEGISKLGNLVSGKDLSKTKTTADKYIQGKEKQVGNIDSRTKEYLDFYVNTIYRDFSNNPNFFNENQSNNTQSNQTTIEGQQNIPSDINITQNETTTNDSNITEQTITETLVQPGNTTNETTSDIQTSQSEAVQTVEPIQIDENLFNDNADLNEEQLTESENQVSNAISFFESFNSPQQGNQNQATEKSRQSNNGRYNVIERTSADGSKSFELLDSNNSPVNLTNKQKDVYVAEYINSQEYPETQLNLSEGMNPNEVSQEIINNTQNPKELAELIVSTPQFDSQSVVGSKEWAIAQVIGRNNVSRDSFTENDDANNITNGIARTYFGKNKSGKSLDNIAQEASEQFTGDYNGDSVTIQDVVDFIKTYPNDPSKAERPNNPLYDSAVAKFIQLTGQNPTKNLLDKLVSTNPITDNLNLQSADQEYNRLSIEQQNELSQEYDNWFNGLNEQQKLEELYKTYPDYEQSNESNISTNQNESTSQQQGEDDQNVGNEEKGTQFQQSNENFEQIDESTFNNLIEQLKKPFKNAFKNLNVTTNLQEATQRAQELEEDISELEFKTSSGNVYGFKLSDGTIYINPNNLNVNTAIHEFSHLWEQLLPNAWRNGMKIFKDTSTGKRIFNQLKSDGNYSNLTDDQIWSEALNTHIGNYGEWRNNNPKGKMKEFSDWIKNIFSRIGNYFGLKTNPETSLRQFTEGVLGDLLGGRELSGEANNSSGIQFSLGNKNVIPKSTFAKVVNATSTEGKQSGYNELVNSSWFNGLTESIKSNTTVENFHNLMLDQAKLIQENDAVKREQIREKAKQKAKEQISKAKQDANEKIAEIIDKYKNKIKDIKADAKKTAKEKSLEQKRALRTAVKDIKSHLASNTYIGKITPAETNRLIRKASEIGTRKDISAAVNEFTKLYDDIRAKAESRLQQKEFTLDEYNELKPIIEELVNNGNSLSDIYDAVRRMKLSNKREGVLNEMYENKVRDIFEEINNSKLTPEEAYNQMQSQQDAVTEAIRDKRTRQQKIKSGIRNFIKYVSDRQYLPKKLLQEIGANNTVNRMITMAGSSSRASEIYNKLDEKIFKGLKQEDKSDLNKMIVALRILSIEKNRNERGLPPIKHPYANPEEGLKFLKEKLGDEKYADLEKRANEYFKAFKGILSDMRDNGLISQDGYESMVDIDYQPRIFIDRLLNAEGNLDEDGNFQNFSGQNGGLKSEILKSLSDGSNSAIIDNSEWLLKTALSSRYKAMAMNEVNRRFMTDEFWKAKDRFDNIDPNNFANKSDQRFYEYFKELQTKIKDNPIVGVTESGNPKYKYDSTPQGFKKAYYYVDGIRNEFFLAEDFHKEWHDVKEGLIFDPQAKGIINKWSGAGLIKAMATGYNPTFAFTNTPRDFMQTLVFSPEYSNNLLIGTFQLGYDQVKALTRMYKSDFQGKEDSIFEKYIEYGGGMDFLHVQGLVDQEQKTSKAIQKVLDSNIFQVATLMKLSKWSEMMTRMAIFERSIQNQLKELGLKNIDQVDGETAKDDIYYKAVANARSIMDFNQGGKLTKDLDAIMPYLNAATQGTRVAVDAFRDRPAETSIRMFQAGALMASTAIGVSYALLAMTKGIGGDDDEKSINQTILNAYDGLSQYQRANYINIVLPSKNDKGENYVFKIAKTQFVAPLSYIMEEGLLGVIRKIEGKPEKDFTKVIQETGWVANKNMTPIEFAKPQDFITSIATKNPLMKASLTYVTGYDFFKDEVVTFDVKKSNFPRELEGYKDDNIEDFYKGIGSLTGGSPARTKAFVESIVTTPETNPFVTMMYGGADLTNAVIQGDSKTEVATELKDNIAKVFTKRLIGQASDFNRMRREREEVEKKVEKAILEDEKIKLDTDILARKFNSGTVNEQDIANKFNEMNLKGEALDKAYKRLEDKISNKASDTRIYDIKYSTSNSNVAKAILIKKYFPQVYENSVEGEAIRAELKQFKVYSKDVQQELINIRENE